MVKQLIVPTIEVVQFHPPLWPNSVICITVRYSLPVCGLVPLHTVSCTGKGSRVLFIYFFILKNYSGPFVLSARYLLKLIILVGVSSGVYAVL